MTPPGKPASHASDSPEVEAARHAYARQMAQNTGSCDPRLGQAFAHVPREAFMPPGPWRICLEEGFVEQPDTDPRRLYRNALVALDPAKGINNGEPFLHAAWIGAVAPQPGETIVHIGAGTGYYTAILSMLAQPGGAVIAYEIDDRLAQQARSNLAAYPGVTMIHGDATLLALPRADIIYVNAGVAAPPVSWLQALRPGGRLIFPWRPAEDVGLAVRVNRTSGAFSVTPLMSSWFIPCTGETPAPTGRNPPTPRQARSARSLWLTCDRPPDQTAVATYDTLWFSSSVAPIST